MPWQQIAGYCAEGALALLAILIARRKVYHAPFATYACFRLLVDPARGLLAILRGTPPPHPLEGGARVLYHLSGGSFQALSLAIAVLAASVYAPRARWHMVGASLGVLAASVAVYPIGAGRLSMTITHAAAVGVGWACFALWLRRREWPTPTAILVLLFLATETAVLAGPFVAGGSLSAAWPMTWAAYLGAHIAAVMIHLAWLADVRADDQRRVV